MIENDDVIFMTMSYLYFNSFFVFPVQRLILLLVCHIPFSDIIIRDMSVFDHVESMPRINTAKFYADFRNEMSVTIFLGNFMLVSKITLVF